MNPYDYLMDELWPLLDSEQKAQILALAEMLARFAPRPTV